MTLANWSGSFEHAGFDDASFGVARNRAAAAAQKSYIALATRRK